MARTNLLAPLVLLASLAGCADPAKRPADEAIQGTDAALAAVRSDAARYVPAQLQGVEDGLAKAKAAFAKGDYQGSLAAARDLPAKATAVGAAAAARKEEESRSFAMATAQLPQLLEAIRIRLDDLSTARKLPKGIDAATMASAREDLASVTRALDEATASATAGKMAEALAAARPLRSRSLAVAGRLGLATGAPPPSK